MSKKIDVILLTGRSLQQGMGLGEGKTSDNYFRSVNYVELNSSDVKELGLNKDDTVEVVTDYNKVTLFWRISEELSPGSIFIPYGLWANQVFSSDTNCTGTPHLKGIKASIKSAERKRVLTLVELVKQIKEGS